MSSIDIALDLIRKHEGFKPHAYQDSEGYWTIGTGILIDEKVGGGITKEEDDLLLRNRTLGTVAFLEKQSFWVYLNDVRAAALIDMAFNLGQTKFLKFTGMIAALDAQNWNGAADEMLDSLWAKQTGNRAIELSDMMRKG